MGGVETRVSRSSVTERGEMEEEKEISKEEIDMVIRKMKEGKAAGRDGIAHEVWKYGGKEIMEWFWVICNRSWKEEGWPEDWREGVVIPILKKSQGEKVKDYRGITMTQTASKIYACRGVEGGSGSKGNSTSESNRV